MSAALELVLPATLALISLSSSYLYYNAATQDEPPVDPSINLPPAPPPWAYITNLASPVSDSSSSISDVDFDKETFTFRLPPILKHKPSDGFLTLHKNPLSLSSMPSDAELAGDALNEESLLRFPSFKMEDAVVLGMNLRKRFRASLRHAKGKGCVISIQTMQGATMFACAVGEGSDVSLDSWWHVEGMIKVVRRTGHSTFYIERGSNAIGKPADTLGLPFPEYRLDGGAFPLWLQNSTVGPIGIMAIYSGSSVEDHHLVVATLRSYFSKLSTASDRGASPLPGDNDRSADHDRY